MKTRHLVSLVTGILIFSVLVPICLSIWLAHRQAEDKFVDALDNYASRVLIRTDKVVTQAKEALNHLQAFEGVPCSPPPAVKGDATGRFLVAICAGSDLYRQPQATLLLS